MNTSENGKWITPFLEIQQVKRLLKAKIQYLSFVWK